MRSASEPLLSLTFFDIKTKGYPFLHRMVAWDKNAYFLIIASVWRNSWTKTILFPFKRNDYLKFIYFWKNFSVVIRHSYGQPPFTNNWQHLHGTWQIRI